MWNKGPTSREMTFIIIITTIVIVVVTNTVRQNKYYV